MVRFVFGGAGAGKSEYIFREIERTLRETDRRVLLLVPEQYTVTTEAAAARRFGGAGQLRFEATNFTRLADSVARRVGGLSYSRLSDGARKLVLWRALVSVWAGLGELNRVSESGGVGLIPTLYSAHRELAMAGVSPRALADASAEIEADGGESSLSRRLSDLSIALSAADELLAGEFGQLEDPVLRLGRTAGESGFFRNTAVFIDSFYSLTGTQSAALAQIIACAEDVTVAIPLASRDERGVHLDGVRAFYESVLSAALRFGEGRPEFITLEGNHRAKSESLKLLSAHLWDYSYEGAPVDDGSVEVYSVEDRYAEAEAVCSKIAGLVRGGAKYSDIVVACADVGRLRGILDSALRTHEIPAFIAESTRVSSSPAVRLILSLLRIPGKWRREDVISIVKSGLSCLTDELACAFELYTETWDIRGEKMFASEWSMNPDGYRESITERGAEVLLRANDARDALIPAIGAFCEIFEGGRATVRNVCSAIVEYFEKSGAWEAFLARCDRLEAVGSVEDAARERLVWDEICHAFDTMCDVLGELETDASGFAALFRHVIADADTGAIPTGVDSVTVAGARTLRTNGAPHVILLGAVEGEFPEVPADDGYFSDADKKRLEELGIILSADSGQASAEAMFRFVRVISQAAETLTVLIPGSDGGSPVSPSEGAMRILQLLGRGEATPFDHSFIYDKASLDMVLKAGGDEGLIELRRRLFGEPPGMTAEDPTEASISKGSAASLFPHHLRLSQSRTDAFVKCPMMYYCRYVLSLSEDKTAEVSAPDVGIFVHGVLEDLLKHIGSGDSIPEGDELEALCDRIIESLVERMGFSVGDGRVGYLIARLRRQVLVFAEAIIREISQSRFKVYGTELPLGMQSTDSSAPPAVVFKTQDGGEVSLHGYIDRLDVYERDGKTYIRIIDYKTGSKQFSYEDVRIGLNIQLLLYLFAAWRSEGSAFAEAVAGEGEILPAGALYFTVRPADRTHSHALSAEEAREIVLSSVERSGVVTDEVDVLDAMDSGITGKYVPVTKNKDGSLKRSASLATLERFGELYRELEDTVCHIALDMRSGRASATPLEGHGSSPCMWCRMRTVCRREG